MVEQRPDHREYKGCWNKQYENQPHGHPPRRQPIATKHELITVLADPDLDQIPPPPHALVPKMMPCLWNRRPHDSVMRIRQLEPLLDQHHREVAIVAKAGVETAHRAKNVSAKYSSHPRYDCHNTKFRLDESRHCKFERVLDFLHSGQKINVAVVDANVGGNSANSWIFKRQEPMRHDSILNF